MRESSLPPASNIFATRLHLLSYVGHPGTSFDPEALQLNVSDIDLLGLGARIDSQSLQRCADVDYVHILHLAATTMECEVERALKRLLESSVRFDYAVVRQLSAPASPEIPAVELPGTVGLGVYDKLLAGGAR